MTAAIMNTMTRIIIIGCGGSGKSTLAKELGRRLSLPVVHLDTLYWRAGWEHVSREAFDAALAVELAKPAWIIEGNYDRTAALRLRACDTAIYLDYARAVCLWGVLRRRLRYRGKTRSDMAQGCREHADAEFLRWVWTFRRVHHQKYTALLQDAQNRGVNVLIFPNRRACAEWLARL